MTTLEKVLQLIKNCKMKDFPLEKAVGLSQGSIKHWRKPDAPTPSAETLTKIANYFDVSIDYLLGRPMPEYQEIYESLSPKLQEEATQFIKQLKDKDKERTAPASVPLAARRDKNTSSDIIDSFDTEK